MKNLLKFFGISLGCYSLSGVIFYGYHAYMLPLFLALTSGIFFFLLKGKEKSEIRKLLTISYLPFLIVFAMTAIFTENFRLALPYVIFITAVAVTLFYALTSHQKVIFTSLVVVLIAVSLFSFSFISGSNEVFNTAYLHYFNK